MFRDDAQACTAICALLCRMPATRNLWSAQGPTSLALTLREHDDGQLLKTERTLLLAGFALWGPRERRLLFSDVLDLDGGTIGRICSLMVATALGPTAVDDWIVALSSN